MIQKKLKFGLLAAMLGLAALAAPVAALAANVWVNTNSVYHCPGTQYYGNTKRGAYLTESAAVSRGYRPHAIVPVRLMRHVPLANS